MRKSLRASRRLVAVATVLSVYSVLFGLGRLLLSASPERRTLWRAWIFRRWSATLLKVMGVRQTVIGEPPQAPFFLVSNHLSYVDVLVLASRLHAVFVAKSEVASWPVFGPICRSLDTIFVDRSSRRDLSRVIEAAGTAFARGDGVVIFPEGTSTAGAEVLPFLPSLLELPASLGEPVHHASVSYSTAPGDAAPELTVCWWGDMKFAGHFWGLLRLSRIDVRLAFGQESIHADDRKVLATTLHRAVSADFRPVVGSEA